jgi:hypothetical protein
LTRLCRTPWQPLGAYQAGVYEALAESNEANIAVILWVPNWHVCESDFRRFLQDCFAGCDNCICSRLTKLGNVEALSIVRHDNRNLIEVGRRRA